MPEAMNDPRLTLLIDRYLDGSLSPAEKIELETELLAHAGRADNFGRKLACTVHCTRPCNSVPPSPSTTPVSGRPSRIGRCGNITRRCSCLPRYLLLVVQLQTRSAPRLHSNWPCSPIGTARRNEFETGEIILSGDLRIAQGTVGLSLFNAVTLTVQGPAHLDLRSPENIILHQGRLHAHVPEPAKGFTITTSAGDW